MNLLTGEKSFLSQPLWREVPFRYRRKTSLDELTDVYKTDLRLETTTTSNAAGSDIMVRLLRNARRLCSPLRPELSPELKGEVSRSIHVDAEQLLTQGEISFRMALQCVFSIHLVVFYAPCALLRRNAEGTFRYWHGRYTL